MISVPKSKVTFILIAFLTLFILKGNQVCAVNILVDSHIDVTKEITRTYVASNAVTIESGQTSSDSIKKESERSIVSDSRISKIDETFEKPYNKINEIALWLMGDDNVSDFKFRMLKFGNDNLPVFLNQYYRILIERTYTYPIVIFFIFFTLLLLFNVTLVLFLMYISNNWKNQRERYIVIYQNSYEEVFRSYLFGEIDWDRALLKIKKKNRRLNRKILTEVLLVFKENLRGEMDTQISQIYRMLGLQKDSLSMLKSYFYHRKIEGLKALTNLDPESAKEILPKFLNNKHLQVRTEAQVSYVRLHPENPFDFLKTLTSPFPRWTQLSAFHIFRLYQIPVPAFIEFINSGVPTVRNFSLRMINFFQQLENASAIQNLLDSPYEATRTLAIKAVNDLRLYDSRNKVKEMYELETAVNKIEIIKAIKNIGDQDDFKFLESIILTGNISQKIEACRSLYYVNNEGKARLDQLKVNSNLNIDQYLAHVTDPRN